MRFQSLHQATQEHAEIVTALVTRATIAQNEEMSARAGTEEGHCERNGSRKWR